MLKVTNDVRLASEMSIFFSGTGNCRLKTECAKCLSNLWSRCSTPDYSKMTATLVVQRRCVHSLLLVPFTLLGLAFQRLFQKMDLLFKKPTWHQPPDGVRSPAEMRRYPITPIWKMERSSLMHIISYSVSAPQPKEGAAATLVLSMNDRPTQGASGVAAAVGYRLETVMDGKRFLAQQVRYLVLPVDCIRNVKITAESADQLSVIRCFSPTAFVIWVSPELRTCLSVGNARRNELSVMAEG